MHFYVRFLWEFLQTNFVIFLKFRIYGMVNGDTVAGSLCRAKSFCLTFLAKFNIWFNGFFGEGGWNVPTKNI